MEDVLAAWRTRNHETPRYVLETHLGHTHATSGQASLECILDVSEGRWRPVTGYVHLRGANTSCTTTKTLCPCEIPLASLAAANWD
jgi:hypothetical protein